MLVSIITPSLNQARFIQETIDSVLAQDYYADLEYYVVDGGSTDGTIEILKSYGPRLRWVSEEDLGQSHAINKGLTATSGEVVAYLNSDDILRPNAVSRAVAALRAHPKAGVVFGDADYIDAEGQIIGKYPTKRLDTWHDLLSSSPICQPAAFIRREAVLAVGGLREDLHLSMDYALWVTIAERYPLAYVPETWAASRLHPDAKTVRYNLAQLSEVINMFRARYGKAPAPWLQQWARVRVQTLPLGNLRPVTQVGEAWGHYLASRERNRGSGHLPDGPLGHLPF